MRGFMPGRFQPFHKGHLHAVRYALGLVEELVIGVTASQFNYTPENPFTAGERLVMVRLALGDLYGRCYVVPLDNVVDNSTWLRHVRSRVPDFKVIFTNNDFVRLLAESEGLRVVPIPFLERERYSGTRIRRLMAEGGPWEDLVPPPVAEYLRKIGGAERVRRLFRSERVALPPA